MKSSAWKLSRGKCRLRMSLVLLLVTFAAAQSSRTTAPATNEQQPATEPGANSSSEDKPKSSAASTAMLEREFFEAIRNTDTHRFLSYVPDSGINYGKQPQHLTRSEVEDQLLHRRGLFCILFDSSCIDGKIELDASARTCSDRELLMHSDKVRTAASEVVRSSVRQAILVAEVKNSRCPNQNLIDFIFNYEDGGWKLFSVP